jgi:Coenzyme PQQ synthesis protein D (PqqD)
MLRPDSILAASCDQVSCDLGGETCILHLSSGIYYGLDSVGARVWDLLQAPRTLGELQALVLREFDVAADRAARDLGEFCESLERAGLVRLQ